ncbi:LuxR family transcriptional regulator [Mycetocola zhadangensis]|uniref:LuxR family transcriptional regulator n=1 Tax=Mycetocola zhadangensis TaxID=1164595 RepID=A0A3L7J164_9MICO|nr:LuxR family transcriptional regulator [Mycetocola zhadangensis]
MGYSAFHIEVAEGSSTLDAERERLVSHLLSRLGFGTGVVIAAAWGAGKSFMLSRLVTELRSVDTQVSIIKVRGARSTKLVLDYIQHAQPNQLLAIDDAHALSDEAFTLLLNHLVETGTPFIATISTEPSRGQGEPLRGRDLSALWTDLDSERVDLKGVGYDEATRIVNEASGKVQLDAVTRAQIIGEAAGSPLLLRELTQAAVDSDGWSLGDSFSLAVGPAVVSSRLIELVAPQLGELTERDRVALIVLAKLGPVAYPWATRLFGTDVINTLVRRRFIRRNPGSVEGVSTGVLYANVLLADADPVFIAKCERDLEQALVCLIRDGADSPEACVVVGTLWANDEDGTPATAGSPAEAARILERAAERANSAGHPISAELFARRARALHTSPGILEQLSRARAAQRDVHGAFELLENSPAAIHTERENDIRLLSWWMTLIQWDGDRESRRRTCFDVARSWGTVNDLVDDWEVLTSAGSELVESRYARGIDHLERLLEARSTSPEIRLRSLTALVPAYVYTGRARELDTAIDLGRTLASELIAVGSADSPEVRHASLEFLLHSGLFRGLTGTRSSTLMKDANSFALKAADSGDVAALACVNIVAGHAALVGGRADQALSELLAAAKRVEGTTAAILTPLILLLLTHTLAVLKQSDSARAMRTRLAAFENTRSPWQSFGEDLGLVQLLISSGDTDAARQKCLSIADTLDRRCRLMLVRVLHLAYALGEPAKKTVAQLGCPPPVEQCEVTRALEEHLRAADAADAFRLDAAATHLQSIGLFAESALAYGAAHVAHLAHGRTEAATSSFTAASHLAQGRGWTDSPGQRHATPQLQMASSPLALLTKRELEVGRLASVGLSNAEIAERLYLSVRTVESHILQARKKLGAGRRTELALHFRHTPGTHAGGTSHR